MSTGNQWAEIKSRLDVLSAASQLDLKPKGKEFTCPSCGGAKKAMSKDGIGWFCAKCREHGDGIDLFRICLGVSPKEALRQAAYSIGINLDDMGRDDLPDAPSRIVSEPWVLHPVDIEERYAALTVAANHYERLRLEAHDYARSIGGQDLERDNALSSALEYIHIRRGLPPKRLPIPVGVCPWWKTGLHQALHAEGGDEMVAAGFRAGVLVPKRGGNDFYEFFRGRITLPWVRPVGGQTVYIKGRSVPETADATHTKRVPHLGLRTNPNDPEKQPHVPRPEVPFGATWADQLFSGKPIIVQEAEIDALSAMMAKIPSVAIGGTAGVGGGAVKSYLNGRASLVLWDNDWRRAEEQARAGKPKKTWATEVAISAARKLGIELGCDWNLIQHMESAKDLNQVLVDRGTRGVEEEVVWALNNRVGPNDATPGHLMVAIENVPMVQGNLSQVSPPPPTVEELTRGDIPKGWEIRQGQLLKGKWDKRDSTWVMEPVGIDRTPVVTAHVVDVHSEAWHVEVETAMIGGGTKRFLARRSVVGAKKAVIALADQGLDVTGESAGWMVKWLDDYQRHNKNLPVVHGSEQFGWHGDRADDDLTFLLGERSMGTMDLRYVGGDVKLQGSVKTRGTMAAWRRVPELLAKYPRGLVVLYAALAAPCINFIDEMSGFCVEVCGPSTTGKSTASQAAASVIASPKHGYIRSGAAGDSVPGLEHTMAAGSDCPIFVEDTHKYPPEQQARLAMMAANGEGKARSNRTGTSRLPTKQWRTVAIFTTESPVSATTSFVGDQARTITLRPPMENIDAEEDIDELQRVASRNYGHAFVQWVAHLQSGGWMQIASAYDKWHKYIRTVSSADSVQRRWAKPWALIAAVADCAAPVLGLDTNHAEIINKECQRWFDGRETPSQARTALETIIEWAATRVNEVTRDSDGAAAKGQREVWIRIIGEESAEKMGIPEGCICFASQRLRAELGRHINTSLAVVLPTWRDKEWAVGTTTRLVRMGHGSVRSVIINPRKVELAFDKDDRGGVPWRKRHS